jgi:hypothetical protein
MKKALFLLFSFICTELLYSQSEEYFSTEFELNYYSDFIDQGYSNDLNYAFSILISKYIKKLKISSGINYSIKSYVSRPEIVHSIQKRKYNLENLNFPIIATYKISSKERNSLSVFTGFVLNQILNDEKELYYLSGETIVQNNLIDNQNLGATLVLGTTFTKSIGNKYRLNLSPCINYIAVSNNNNQRPSDNYFPDYKLSVGLKIGLEYLFKSIKI